MTEAPEPVASWTEIDPNTGETLRYETFIRSEFDPPPPGEIVETLEISTRVEAGSIRFPPCKIEDWSDPNPFGLAGDDQ